MSELEELRRRIDRLEARAEIAELGSAYAVACDEHDMSRLTSLFTEDAVFSSASGVMEAEGRDAIAAMFVGMFKVRGPGYHWTHDRFVEFDPSDPDRATGLVLSHAETSPNNEVSVAAMRYNDEYRRVNGRWLFQKRIINFFYYMPVRDFATGFNQLKRITVNGASSPADYPESLPNWQQFDREHDIKR